MILWHVQLRWDCGCTWGFASFRDCSETPSFELLTSCVAAWQAQGLRLTKPPVLAAAPVDVHSSKAFGNWPPIWAPNLPGLLVFKGPLGESYDMSSALEPHAFLPSKPWQFHPKCVVVSSISNHSGFDQQITWLSCWTTSTCFATRDWFISLPNRHQSNTSCEITVRSSPTNLQHCEAICYIIIR